MKTSVSFLANRRNAKKSTGPRTVAGKQRVVSNALRHGLAVPIEASSDLDRTVAALARRIVGDSPSTNLAELARRVAGAQIDFQRVRAAKLAILNGSIGVVLGPTLEESIALIRQPALEVDVNSDPAMAARLKHVSATQETGTEPDPAAARIAESFRDLAKLERYERRALSRRKFAMRDFDARGRTSLA